MSLYFHVVATDTVESPFISTLLDEVITLQNSQIISLPIPSRPPEIVESGFLVNKRNKDELIVALHEGYELLLALANENGKFVLVGYQLFGPAGDFSVPINLITTEPLPSDIQTLSQPKCVFHLSLNAKIPDWMKTVEELQNASFRYCSQSAITNRFQRRGIASRMTEIVKMFGVNLPATPSPIEEKDFIHLLTDRQEPSLPLISEIVEYPFYNEASINFRLKCGFELVGKVYLPSYKHFGPMVSAVLLCQSPESV